MAKKTYDPDKDEAGKEGRSPQLSPAYEVDPKNDLDPVDRELAKIYKERVEVQYHAALPFRRKFDQYAAIHSHEFFELSDRKAVVFPVLQTAITELNTLMAEGMFPQTRFMEYAPGSPSTEWRSTETMTQMVLDGFRKCDLRSIVEDELLDDLQVFGTAIEEICFETKVGHRKTRDRKLSGTLTDDGELTLKEKEVSATGNYYMDASGFPRRVDPRQVVFSQLYGRSLKDQDWVARYDAVTWEDIYTQRERKETVIQGGDEQQDVEMIVGRFRDVPRRELARAIPATGLEEDPGETTNESAVGSEQNSRVKGFRVVEIYFRGDFEGDLFRNQAGGEYKFSAAQLKKWQKRHGLKDEDMRPGAGWFRMVFLPDFDWVLEITRNPIPNDELPYRMTWRKKRKNCLYGIGAYEEFWPTQASINAIFRSADDAVKKITDPMYGVPKNTFDSKRGPLGTILKHQGGKLVHLVFGFAGQTGNPLIPIHPPEKSPELAITWLQFVEHQIRTKLGVPPDPGNVVGDRGSATEASLVMGKASQNLKGAIKRFERQMLLPMYDLIYKFYQQYVTLPTAILIHDPQRAKYYSELATPRMFAGEMRAIGLTSTQIAENPVRAQQLVNMIGQLAGMAQESGVQILNVRGAVEEVVRLLELNIPPDRILKSPEQVAQEMQQLAQMKQQMAQQQMAQLGGGQGGMNGSANQRVVAGQGDIAANRAGGQVIQ